MPGALVMTDFARTVHASGDQHSDLLLRPVHWIERRKNCNTVDCLVVNPFEAHTLLPSIRQHQVLTLHLSSPRVDWCVRTLEDLFFYAILAASKFWPNRSFTMLLIFIAGQLYQENDKEYPSICRLLNLAPAHHTSQSRSRALKSSVQHADQR